MNRFAWIVTRFPDYYPKLLQGLLSLADVIQTLLQTLIIGFGLMGILVVMLIVEQHGIYDGLTWFLTDQALAALAAWGFVGLNFVGEFQIAYVESEEGYKEARAYDWSLALITREIAYRLGFKPTRAKSSEWKPRPQSPARRFHAMQKWVTVAIFLLALSGRMKAAITDASTSATGAPVPLAQGLINLQTQSTLGEVVTWVLGTTFTLVALIGVQGITGYVAVRVIEIRRQMLTKVRTAKAAATRERNRSTPPHSRPATATAAAPRVQQVDAFELQTLRDNTLHPIREGDRYICPRCHKSMSRQGWSKHPCRDVVDVVDLSLQARNLLDERLTPQPPIDSQPPVYHPQPEQLTRQPAVNGHHEEG